ncbi:hypothetical protein D3C78_1959370 [compost metagenome]
MLTPACGQADLGSKEVAIAAYASQLKAFNGVPDDLRRPERYWHIEADVQVPSHALPEGC